MSGLVRIVWTFNGETVKDETTPYRGNIVSVGDTAEINAPYGKAPITVDFHFDPPVAPAPPEAERAKEGGS